MKEKIRTKAEANGAMLHVACQSGSTQFNALHSVKILSLVVLDQHLAVSDWILYN